MVLRRMPGAMKDAAVSNSVTSISLDAQAELIAMVKDAGVTVPGVLAVLKPGDDMGEGFVMEQIAGETLPHKILGQPQFSKAESVMARQCSRELAAIHSVATHNLPTEVEARQAGDLLAEQEATYREIGGEIPVFDWAFNELERTLPPTAAPQLVHGDFRMGNLMIDENGISAVLDWELAHLGDPLEDLAYLCTPSWRFGHYDKHVGGFAPLDEFLTEYETASGNAVDPARFHWWLLYNTLWWGVTCLRMGNSWREGTARSLERTIIGRRVSEVEIDLLLLMGRSDDRLDWEEPALLPTSGEIDYAEVLVALGEWSTGVIDQSKGHARFEARVARNAAGMAQRHAAWGTLFANRQSDRLTALGMDNATLCKRLRRGSADPHSNPLWQHLRLMALERLAIDQPKYAGLTAARKRWSIA